MAFVGGGRKAVKYARVKVKTEEGNREYGNQRRERDAGTDGEERKKYDRE